MRSINGGTGIGRREWLAGTSVTLGALLVGRWPNPRAPIKVEVHRNPGCTCCEGWASHMRRAGFDVTIADDPTLTAYKESLHVPPELHTCHTSTIDRFVFEGHIPADVIQGFLKEPGAAIGLGVAGMPAGSPGMEAPTSQPYDVVAFSQTKRWVFAKR